MSEHDIRNSFHYAVAKGYLAIVDRLLKHKLNVDLTNDDGNTALYCASRAGNVQMAIKLLTAGADPCVSSHNGETPLYAAIHSQNVEIVRALIEAEPDVIAARDLQSATPLHVAAERGCEEIVKEILQVIKLAKNLDLYPSVIGTEVLEAVNMDGETALYVATQAGRTEVVHMLLNEKANVCIRNKYGRSMIDCAVTKTGADVVSRIVDTAVKVDRTYINYATLLHRAALNGTPEVIKLLVKRRADINARGIEGMTALHWAACSKNLENLKVLLGEGVSINACASGPRSCAGFTALHFAATMGVPKSIMTLLDAGADINSKCRRGGTALIHAVNVPRDDHLTLEMVAVLLNSGAALNIQDFGGNTALHYCAGDSFNRPKPLTMKILLNFGIDPFKKNSAGKTAVDAAADYGDQHTLMILRDVNLVKECMVCCEMLPQARFVQTTHWDGHDTCKPCAARYLRTEITENGKTSIPCPSGDCAIMLEYEEIRRISDPETFSRFDELLLNRTLEANPNFRWCASSWCSVGQIITNGDDISFFTCIKCKFKTCFVCRTPAHPTMTCLQYQAFLVAEQTPADTGTIDWIKKKTMRCPPPCNIAIEKNDGCDHITCTQCKAEWCWLCSADYNRIRREGNTAHMRSCRYYA